MAGQMSGMAYAGIVAVGFMGSITSAASVGMMAGSHLFTGWGQAKRVRQHGGHALQGHHQQQRQNQYFSAEFEHRTNSIVKKLVLATPLAWQWSE